MAWLCCPLCPQHPIVPGSSVFLPSDKAMGQCKAREEVSKQVVVLEGAKQEPGDRAAFQRTPKATAGVTSWPQHIADFEG